MRDLDEIERRHPFANPATHPGLCVHDGEYVECEVRTVLDALGEEKWYRARAEKELDEIRYAPMQYIEPVQIDE